MEPKSGLAKLGRTPDPHLDLAGLDELQTSNVSEFLDVINEHHIRPERRGAIGNRLIGAVHESDRTLLEEMVTQQILSRDS